MYWTFKVINVDKTPNINRSIEPSFKVIHLRKTRNNRCIEPSSYTINMQSFFIVISNIILVLPTRQLLHIHQSAYAVWRRKCDQILRSAARLSAANSVSPKDHPGPSLPYSRLIVSFHVAHGLLILLCFLSLLVFIHTAKWKTCVIKHDQTTGGVYIITLESWGCLVFWRIRFWEFSRISYQSITAMDTVQSTPFDPSCTPP